MRIDLEQVKHQIEQLFLSFPELFEDDILRADMIEAETDLHGLLAKLVDLANGAGSMAEAIKIRAGALSDRKARYERQEDGIRSLIQSLMEKADLQKVTLPEATLSVSYRKPARIVVDETAVPDDLCKFKRSPDMAKIKDAPELPPGCSLSNGRNVLTVRTK